MRKVLILAVVAMMTTMCAKAQTGYEDTKHEVAVSYGWLSNSQWVDVLEEMVSIMVGSTCENEKFFGPLSAEYFYHANKWLGVGGMFTLSNSKQDVYLDKKKDGTVSHTYYTLMPAVKFDWLRKKSFGMYSKLAVGATLRTESINCDDPSARDSESKVHVNWQASLLGIEAGSPKVRGFLEFGFGEQGVALFGLRYKF